MDRHLAASLDRWLTTPPEADECECDENDCGCEEYDAELQKAEEAQAEYEAAVCVSCNHARYYHGEFCLPGNKGCGCPEFKEESANG